MAAQLKITIVGLGGVIGSVTVDRASTVLQIKEAMADQCQLPGWQYRLIDGVTELITLDNLEVSDPEPGCLPTAQITVVRQADPKRDFDIVSEAIRQDRRTVLHVALSSGFHVDYAVRGTQRRECGKMRTKCFVGTCLLCFSYSISGSECRRTNANPKNPQSPNNPLLFLKTPRVGS